MTILKKKIHLWYKFGFNPFDPEASADELQPVPDNFLKSMSALKNDRPSFKMDITLLFLNQFLNVIYL